MTSQADIGEQKTVLIVEDHSLLRQVMREFLQSAFPACSFREAAGAWLVAGNGQVHHGRHGTKWKRYARTRTADRTR